MIENNTSLHRIMNKKCIIVEDFDPSDDEIDENTDDSDDENESANKLLEDYDQTFMMKISQCGKNIDNKMTFDYAFLAPPKFVPPPPTNIFAPPSDLFSRQKP